MSVSVHPEGEEEHPEEAVVNGQLPVTITRHAKTTCRIV